MIKIEKLLDGAKATFIREGKLNPVFLGQILSDSERSTLKVLTGTVMYTVDESEIVMASAETTGKGIELSLETKSSVESTDSVETTTKTEDTEVAPEVVVEVVTEVATETAPETAEVVTETAPVIVKPAPRKK